MRQAWPDDRLVATGAQRSENHRYAARSPDEHSGKRPHPREVVLRAVLDRLREGIQVWSLGGTTIYENVVMERMLSVERSRSGVPLAEGAAADWPSASHLPKAVEAAIRKVADEPARSIEVGAGDYTVTAEPFDMPGVQLGEKGILVRVRNSGSAATNPDIVTCRFGLTRRQSEVASLLARGLRNDEIARALDMCPSTARRHTECVLAKLGARSRAEVAARLQGAP